MDSTFHPLWATRSYPSPLLLPIARVRAAAQAWAPASLLKSTQRRRALAGAVADRHDILVVDRSLGVAEMLRRGMPASCRVDGVAHGDQGIALLLRMPYRLLLIDLTDPQVDGWGLLRHLRHNPIARPPWVVVLSAVSAAGEVTGILDAGADDYIRVPIDANDLIIRLHLWHQRTPSVLDWQSGMTIRSLGAFRVECDGPAPLFEGGRAPKAAALFAYLLTHHERSVPITEVLRMLWPDLPREMAATNLRSLLHQLRGALGSSAHCLAHTRTTLRLCLCPDDWWDVAEFAFWLSEGQRLYKAGNSDSALSAYSAAVIAYGGDYLVEDSDAHWVIPFRNRLRGDWIRALAALASLRGERGAYDDQELLLRTILSVDPFQEQSNHALIALLKRQGRSVEAMLLYRQFENLLQAEFGVSAAPLTGTLVGHARWMDA
jgi:DNA-binding SARP family transcriptional activator/ActR/RegA family two-component response regulator